MRFLFYFLVFFGLFFTIGFFNGKTEVGEPGFLKKHIFSSAKVAVVEQQVYLAFLRKDTSLYVYDVDSNKLIKLDKEALLQKSEASIPDKGLLSYFNQTVTTGVGGGVFALSVWDIFKNQKTIRQILTSQSGWSKIIGMVAGCVSGYYVGRLIAINYALPNEKSREYSTILANENNWQEGKLILFNELRKQTQAKIDDMEVEKVKRAFVAEQQNVLNYVLVDTGANAKITSSALILQMQLKIKATSSLSQQEGFWGWKSSVRSWFRWTFWSIIITSSFIGVFLLIQKIKQNHL